MKNVKEWVGVNIYRTAATAVKRIAQKQRRRSFFIVFSIFIRHRSLLSIYIYIYIYIYINVGGRKKNYNATLCFFLTNVTRFYLLVATETKRCYVTTKHLNLNFPQRCNLKVYSP